MPRISPKLPLVMSSEGGYAFTKTISEAVEQNLKNLILTIPGERIMDPDFGVGLHVYLFQNSTPEVHEAIRTKIISQAAKYLPFIKFQEILIGEPTPDFRTTTNLVTIKVVYSIESTDDVNILTLTTEQSTI
jgi:phage baseplate assembly protein W